MAAELWNGGLFSVDLQSDEKGFRVYKAKYLVRAEVTDGPTTVFNCSGLPLPGAMWSLNSELDPWVWCRLNKKVSRHKPVEGERGNFWVVEMEFSNKPIGSGQNDNGGGGCQEEQIDDPLLQEPRVSGSFRSEKEEDLGAVSSSYEPLTGPQNEWDEDKPTIEIEQNVPLLELALLASMANTLNDAPLWGCPVRSIKFRPGPWEKKHYGQCYPYYTRKLIFDINIVLNDNNEEVGGWDRDLLDEGTKVLHGHWAPETGSGATFNLTLDSNGRITAASIVSGGSAYPPSKTFILSIPPDATSTFQHTEAAGLKVTTNASGVITSVDATIPDPGYGFEDTTAVAASDGTGWVLDEIGGEVPDPLRPDHFQLFQDRKGNTGRTVLLAGCPISDDQAGKVRVEHYGESNLLLLGIPTSF